MALLWSGKESVLKALRVGLRLDTRCLVVDPFVGLLWERLAPAVRASRGQVMQAADGQTGADHGGRSGARFAGYFSIQL